MQRERKRKWRRLFAFFTTIRLTVIRKPTRATTVPQPKIYPDGQTLPTPKAIDFKPGTLLGSVSGELGLRKYLESNGHT